MMQLAQVSLLEEEPSAWHVDVEQPKPVTIVELFSTIGLLIVGPFKTLSSNVSRLFVWEPWWYLLKTVTYAVIVNWRET
jgi:hypothetical protein